MALKLIQWVKPLFLAVCLVLFSALLLAGLTALGVQAAPPPPGSLDTTFGVGGIITTPIGSGSDVGYAVAIQSDGKIVVAGMSREGSYGDGDFALARYTITGSLDTTFDNDGIVTTPIGSDHDAGTAVAVQNDGKIVVAGLSWNDSGYDFALARYTTNGSLDTTFGVGGSVTTPIDSRNAYGEAMVIHNDKIIVAGYVGNKDWSNDDFALACYTTTGSLDTTFGVGGIVTTSIGNYDNATAVAIQNGKIVVAGHIDNDLALARYTITGSLDTTFGVNGIVTAPIHSFGEVPAAMTIQSDGKIVVAGDNWDGTNPNFTLVRYTTNGSLDTTFGASGIVTTPNGIIASVAIQNDGKIVAAGDNVNESANNDFALARYTSNGSLDTTFGINGIVTTPIGSDDDYGHAVAIQNDGQIVVVGSSKDDSNYADFALARYNNSYQVYLPLVLK